MYFWYYTCLMLASEANQKHQDELLVVVLHMLLEVERSTPCHMWLATTQSGTLDESSAEASLSRFTYVTFNFIAYKFLTQMSGTGNTEITTATSFSNIKHFLVLKREETLFSLHYKFQVGRIKRRNASRYHIPKITNFKQSDQPNANYGLWWTYHSWVSQYCNIKILFN